MNDCDHMHMHIDTWRTLMANLVAQHPEANKNLFSNRYRIANYAVEEAERAVDELCRQQAASVEQRRTEYERRDLDVENFGEQLREISSERTTKMSVSVFERPDGSRFRRRRWMGGTTIDTEIGLDH